jgi:DNA polymerase V
MPTNDTGVIAAAVVAELAHLPGENIEYHRAGVLLYDFLPANALQTDLLGYVDPAGHDRSTARMHAMDGLNLHYGKETVRFASELLAKAWQPRYNMRSPRYATRWDELQIVRLV